ncbi:MAG: NIL domain-containing protein [Thermodesulfobacteriota bacterium]
MYSKILRLRFPRSLADKPVVVHLAKEFDLTFNIFQAAIFPRREGHMVMHLSGHRKNFLEGVKYLKKMGVKVETVAQDVKRNDEVCYRCGLCTAICPTGALSIKRPEMDVIFDPDVCSACELCVAVCPPRAMRADFNSETSL